MHCLLQELSGLQQQLQQSSQEVQRLQSAATAADQKVGQLQTQLDQDHQSHSDAQRHLEVSYSQVLLFGALSNRNIQVTNAHWLLPSHVLMFFMSK